MGINAIKYADLMKNRLSNYIFDWDRILSLEGNTAPYLMYAYARIKGILRKAGTMTNCTDSTSEIALSSVEERRLASKILQLPEVMDKVVTDCFPNLICQYVYELAGLFMTFYERCPVIKAPSEIRDSRLLLCKKSEQTIKLCFDLLGLRALDRM